MHGNGRVVDHGRRIERERVSAKHLLHALEHDDNNADHLRDSARHEGRCLRRAVRRAVRIAHRQPCRIRPGPASLHAVMHVLALFRASGNLSIQCRTESPGAAHAVLRHDVM